MPAHPAPIEPAVRERLLAASVELFTSKGYSATSVREIVGAAGVTKPVLYYYFGSKEGIYLELMQSIYLQFQDILATFSATPGSVRERIVRFATAVFDGFIDNIGVVRLIYSVYFGPPQGAPYFPHDKFFDSMLEVVGELVREGIESGELRQVDLLAARWSIISPMNTIMEEQLCQHPPRIGRSGLVETLNLVLDGLANGGRR